jgi:Glycosyltransferase sugar-binding region containing DXD motif
MNNIIQSLWIGPELSKLERLSIKSFLDNGHEYHLYVYDTVKNIPEGAVVKDANEILDKSEIFYYKNGSVAAFANLFRYTLMYKRGGYWADTDCICVRPFHFDNEIVISSEPDSSYEKNIITTSLLRFKQGSDALLAAIKIQAKHKTLISAGKLPWGSGSKTVSALVEIFKLDDNILPWKTVCTCYYEDYKSLLDPNYSKSEKAIKRLKDIPLEMVCFHMYNELFRREKIDKNGTFHPDSLYEIFKRKHNII